MPVYLDNAATTKPCDEAVSALNRCLTTIYGNPSSLHIMGLDAEKEILAARRQIGDAIGTEYINIFFTSGATESNNLAIFGTVNANKRRGNKIITTDIEHQSVHSPLSYLEENGYDIVRIRTVDGQIDEDELIDAVDDRTILVSAMLVNNESGSIQPIGKVFRTLKRRYPQLITHCDAVQAFCKIPMRASALNADLISISAHKIHGVKGVGALYIKKGVRILPMIHGGGQESGLRPGTESVPLIAAFGEAVRIGSEKIDENYDHVSKLSSYAKAELQKLDDISINMFHEHSPYIMNFSVKGIRSEIMLHFLEEKGIFVSSGSACAKGKKSRVLEAFGIEDSAIDSAIRISFSKYNTMNDIDKLISGIKDGQGRLLRS
ncbi:MAG: cysteine desulfurase [Clostridiales bacterium]|nr:cysteine desulfurase [Clostridiales bacterium]